MSFRKTEQLLHNYNTSTSAKLPMLNDISANMVKVDNGITLSIVDRKKIEESFKSEYIENNKNKIPFFGCSHNVFKKFYKKDLKMFLSQYPDGNEIDFIESELSIGVMKFEFPFAGDYMNAMIRLSLKRRYEYLVERLNLLGYKLQYYIEKGENYTLGYSEFFKIEKDLIFKKEQEKKSVLKWQLSQTELIELIKSLIETKAFNDNVSEKELVKHLEKFLNIKINNYESVKNKIRNRIKDCTPFLDKLKINMIKWAKYKD